MHTPDLIALCVNVSKIPVTVYSDRVHCLAPDLQTCKEFLWRQEYFGLAHCHQQIFFENKYIHDISRITHLESENVFLDFLGGPVIKNLQCR